MLNYLTNMIDLVNILAKYGWTRTSLCKELGLHPNNFSRLKDIDNQKFSTIEKIHNITNIPYNVLFGRTVFTPDNIDNQTDNTNHTSLSDDLVTIKENEIHLHPKFAEAIRKAIQDNKE